MTFQHTETLAKGALFGVDNTPGLLRRITHLLEGDPTTAEIGEALGLIHEAEVTARSWYTARRLTETARANQGRATHSKENSR